MESSAANTVLLVEDDPFIALDAQQSIMSSGIDCLVAYNVKAADRIITESQFQCALLDFDLGRETSLPIAGKLDAMGRQYCFITGRARAEIPERLSEGARMFAKPADYAAIAREMLRCRTTSDSADMKFDH